MKITLDFVENKKITVAGVEKELKEVTYRDETDTTINATIWRFDKDNKEFPGWAEIAPGSEIDANPWSNPTTGKIALYAPRAASTGGAKSGGYKSAQISEAMDKKNQNIQAAQDRSAWMWAKTNASSLIAGSKFVNDYESRQEMADAVLELATLIYNGEPTEPFTS
jgi:hypothetical protein